MIRAGGFLRTLLGRRDVLSFSALFVVGVTAGIVMAASTGMSGTASFAAIPEKVVAAPRLDARLRVRPVRVVSQSSTAVLPEVPSVPLSLIPLPPQVAVVIDDLGLSWEAFERLNAIETPLTLAFLPYGRDTQAMIDAVAPQHTVILHLPLEAENPLAATGPGALTTDMDAVEIRARLNRVLNSVSGFAGVNNHTGSKFTSDRAAMRVLLQELAARNLFFLDSWTTQRPVAHRLADATGAFVLRRDVFLDSEPQSLTHDAVRAQFAEAEAIARDKGFAIVIGHPFPETLDVLEEWLGSAGARGLEPVLVTAFLPRPAPAAMAGLR